MSLSKSAEDAGPSDATTNAEGRNLSGGRQDPWQRARTLWRKLLRISRRTPRRLRLCESLPLGDRRFVAVVEFEQARFLLGGTSASLVLLARLETTAHEVAASVADEQWDFRKERR